MLCVRRMVNEDWDTTTSEWADIISGELLSADLEIDGKTQPLNKYYGRSKRRRSDSLDDTAGVTPPPKRLKTSVRLHGSAGSSDKRNCRLHSVLFDEKRRVTTKCVACEAWLCDGDVGRCLEFHRMEADCTVPAYGLSEDDLHTLIMNPPWNIHERVLEPLGSPRYVDQRAKKAAAVQKRNKTNAQAKKQKK